MTPILQNSTGVILSNPERAKRVEGESKDLNKRINTKTEIPRLRSE